MKTRYFESIVLIILIFITSCADENGIEPKGDLDPMITLLSPTGVASAKSGEQISLDILFADDNGLASISLSSVDLGIDESVSLNGEKSYQYQETLIVQGNEGTYDLLISVTDKKGNVTTSTLSVTILSEQTYEVVYAVGDMAWNGWDPTKAMPMTADTENPGFFKITLYSDGDDDGVKFLGQLDWAGNNWGLVSSSDPTQGIVDADNSEKILLEIGYHVIRFNPSNLEYTTTKIEESLPTPNGQFHIVGRGFAQEDGTPIDLNWDPSKAYPMVQDERNPYQYRLTVQFVGHAGDNGIQDTQLKFNGNQAWDDLDWGFPSGGSDGTPSDDIIWTETAKSFGANYNFSQDRFGTYELILDEYLGLAQIRKTE